MQRIKIEQHTFMVPVWVAAWLFTVEFFADLPHIYRAGMGWEKIVATAVGK